MSGTATHQLDMFAVMANPMLDIDPISDDREPWETFRTRQEAAFEAEVIETLTWGKGDRTRGPNYTLDLWRDGHGWRYRVSVALGNGGSWGQFSRLQWASREAAMLHAFRGRLRRIAARLQQRDECGEHANSQQLAEWIITQADPLLFGGANLANEFAQMCAEETARECRRRIALAAVHDLHARAQAVLRQVGVDAYGGGWDGGLIQNKTIKESPGAGADPVAHAAAWPAEWKVVGHAPDRLGIAIFPRQDQEDSDTVRAVIAALTQALPEPVELEDYGDGRPYYPLRGWTWDEIERHI